MERDEVLRIIRNHKGPIMVPITYKDGQVYVRVVKSDLIPAMSGIADHEFYVETGKKTHDQMTLYVEAE